MSIANVHYTSYSVAGFGDTLTHDLAHRVPSAMAFFPRNDWRDVVTDLKKRTYPRADVCAVLQREAARTNADPRVFENIQLFSQPETYVVATGQQAGLLGGPLYTLHKALSVIKRAAQLTEESRGLARFVPLFWVASDDHDLAEIDHATLLGSDGDLHTVRLPLTRTSVGCSACDAHFNATPQFTDTLRSEFEAGFPDPDSVQKFIDLYSHVSVSDVFSALLTQWMGHLGLIVVQSHHLRALTTPLLLRELDTFDVTRRLIQEAAVAMQKSGYKPGFSGSTQAAPHFFIAASEARIRAHVIPDGSSDVFRESGSAFAVRGQTPQKYSKKEMVELIQNKPELFSSSAALRPVVQNFLFPVVSTVLGPGEIRYWAQLSKVHDHFGVPWPMVEERASMTLIDPPGEKSMRKLGIAPESPDLFVDPAALQKKVLTGGEVGARLDTRIAHISAEMELLANDVNSFDGGLRPLLEKSRQRIEHELARIAEKAKAGIDQREGASVNRVRYLSSLVRPKKGMQERILNTGQWLNRFPTLPDELLGAMDTSRHEHMIVSID